MTSRAGKTAEGSHEYKIKEDVTACLMGNDEWVLYRIHDGKLWDMGHSFKTLAAARRWVRDHPNA